MKIKLGHVVLNINFMVLFIYLIVLALLISLGFWQLGRAEQKRQFLEKEKQSESKQSISLDEARASDLERIRYREIEMSGYYDLEHQYLIDNQIHNSQAGYFVMTPFIINSALDRKIAVLVNRGWLPLNKDRSVLPNLTITTSTTQVRGRINHFPVVGFRLQGAEIPTQGWPSVVQVVDVEVLSEKLGYDLLTFQVELDLKSNDGYTREWTRHKIMPPEKHVAYAVQWFGLAITLTILMLWMSRKSQ